MPRQARIDTPGALRHIMIRWIERRIIFRDDQDRDDLIARLGSILTETPIPCHAWVPIPNQAHLLLAYGFRALLPCHEKGPRRLYGQVQSQFRTGAYP